jgi:cell division septum initiation protein DivIVA
MGTKAKYTASPRTKKTFHITEEVDAFLDKVADELKCYCMTSTKSDVVQCLLEGLRKDWASGKAKQMLLSRIYTY